MRRCTHSQRSRCLCTSQQSSASVVARAAREPANVITHRVLEIRYKHLEDGKLYKHTFAAGVCARLLPNGDVLLYQKNGKPLMKNFTE